LSMMEVGLKSTWEMSANYNGGYRGNFQSGFSYTGF